MKIKNKQYAWLDIVILVILAVFGIFIRWINVSNMTDFPMIINNALILETSQMTNSMFSMESIYTSIFSFFFSFVGNKIELAIYFQIVLQVLAIFLLYFSIKEITNCLCAWISYAIFIASPFFLALSINQLFFLFFSILFALSAFFTYRIADENRSLTGKWIFSLFLALVFSQFMVVDDIFLVLIIFGFALTIIYPNARKENVLKTRIMIPFSYLMGVILSICAYVFSIYKIEKEPLYDAIQEVITNIIMKNSKHSFFLQELKISVGENPFLIYILCSIFLLLFLFSFLPYTRKSAITITLLLLGFVSFPIFFTTTISPLMEIAVLACILLVLGIQGLFSMILNKTPKVSEPEMIEHALEEIKFEEVTLEEGKLEEDKLEEDKLEEEKSMEEPIKKIKFIDNPLPVPKKHIPKTLDYRFEPREEDMHYDLED